jgi:nitrous oxidase accessory protein
MMKLLLASPAVQTLRLVGRQFPLLRAPSIVDPPTADAAAQP